MALAVNSPAKRVSGHRVGNACVGSNPALRVCSLNCRGGADESLLPAQLRLCK